MQKQKTHCDESQLSMSVKQETQVKNGAPKHIFFCFYFG